MSQMGTRSRVCDYSPQAALVQMQRSWDEYRLLFCFVLFSEKGEEMGKRRRISHCPSTQPSELGG